jgi:hypothetical protein
MEKHGKIPYSACFYLRGHDKSQLMKNPGMFADQPVFSVKGWDFSRGLVGFRFGEGIPLFSFEVHRRSRLSSPPLTKTPPPLTRALTVIVLESRIVVADADMPTRLLNNSLRCASRGSGTDGHRLGDFKLE